jgi:phosphoribulokinase
LLEYQADKREELRVLLPSHIFKMMEFEPLNEPIRDGTGISIVTERKIMKNLEDFKQYFKGANIEDGSINLSAYHRHTHTECFINLRQTRDGVDLTYRHYEGNNNIT